jgi:hypothetical protein
MHLQSRGPCEGCGKSTLTHDCHYTPPDILAKAQALALVPNHNKYFLSEDEGVTWEEVPKADFVSAERCAGFRNTMGLPDEPATAGFSSSPAYGRGIKGKVEYAP